MFNGISDTGTRWKLVWTNNSNSTKSHNRMDLYACVQCVNLVENYQNYWNAKAEQIMKLNSSLQKNFQNQNVFHVQCSVFSLLNGFAIFHIFALHSCNLMLYAIQHWFDSVWFGLVEFHLSKACWNYTIFRKCHKITINFNVETFPFQQSIRWANTKKSRPFRIAVEM